MFKPALSKPAPRLVPRATYVVKSAFPRAANIGSAVNATSATTAVIRAKRFIFMVSFRSGIRG